MSTDVNNSNQEIIFCKMTEIPSNPIDKLIDQDLCKIVNEGEQVQILSKPSNKIIDF